MPKNEELPPIGLPIRQRSSTGYFFGIAAMVVVCGAAALGLGYGWLELSRGPCHDRYDDLLVGLRAEVEFFRKSGDTLGLGSTELHELRTGAQLAEESLLACCEQHEAGSSGADHFAACDAQGAEIAAVQQRLAETRNRPNAAFKVITTAAKRLRGISYDLEDIAAGGQPAAAPGNVAAPPPSGTGSDG